LRNELIHYKGAFLAKDVAPTKKISGLMRVLGVSSEASWIEEDCSTWINDLLGSKKLGYWVSNSIKIFSDSYYDLRIPQL